MSNDPSATTGAGSDADPAPDRGTPLDRMRASLATRRNLFDPHSAVIGSGLVALVAVAVRFAIDIVANLPFDPVVVPMGVRSTAAIGVPVVLSLALVAVAVVAEQATVRTGLLFVGTFGLLSVASETATVPAVVAVVLGGCVALGGTNGWPETYRSLRRRAIGVVLLAGTAVSLGSSTGLLPGDLRGIGSVLVLAGGAAIAIRADDDPVSVVGGLLAFLLVVLASTLNPFVVGSVLLIAVAVVGASPLLVAFAVGGVTTATVAGLRQREWALALGAPLLLLAGVPATIPRALAVVLGATLVLVELTPRASERDTAREGRAV